MDSKAVAEKALSATDVIWDEIDGRSGFDSVIDGMSKADVRKLKSDIASAIVCAFADFRCDAEHDRLQAENEQLRASMSIVQAACAEAEAECAAATAERDKLRARVAELEGEAKQAERDYAGGLTAMATRHGQEFGEAVRDANEQTARALTAEKRVAELDAERKKQSQRADEMAAQLGELKEELGDVCWAPHDAALALVRGHKARIAELEARVAELEAQTNEQRRVLHDLNKAYDASTVRMREICDRNIELEAKLQPAQVSSASAAPEAAAEAAKLR